MNHLQRRKTSTYSLHRLCVRPDSASNLQPWLRLEKQWSEGTLASWMLRIFIRIFKVFLCDLQTLYPSPAQILHSSMISAFDEGHRNSGESTANNHSIGAAAEENRLLFQIKDAGHSITKGQKNWGDMMEVYKLISGKDKVDHRQFFQISSNQYNLLRHNMKLVKNGRNLSSGNTSQPKNSQCLEQSTTTGGQCKVSHWFQECLLPL